METEDRNHPAIKCFDVQGSIGSEVPSGKEEQKGRHKSGLLGMR